MDHASLPEIARLATKAEGIDEVGIELGEDLRDEDRFVRARYPVIRDRDGRGIVPTSTVPATVRMLVLTMDTVPSV